MSFSAQAPLAGITVVSLEQAIAAPICTRHLADLGCRVIKIERPEGDFARGYDDKVFGLSSQFLWANRGKESLALNLKEPDGQQVLERLLERADVFVENLTEDAAEHLGCRPEALAQRHPALVVVSIRGYGRDGPWARRKAYDLLVQCEAGLLSITGTPEEPVKVGISVADIAAGMYALTGVLAALWRRRETGQGEVLSVSLFDALSEWMGYPLYYTRYGGTPPARTGARHATIAPYGPVSTGDGFVLFLAVQNDREWQRLCQEVLGQPELAFDPRFRTNPLRVLHAAELQDILQSAFSAWRWQEAEERLDLAGIAHARLNTLPDVLAHSEIVERRRLRTVSTEVGPVEMLLPPWSTRDWPPPPDTVPALGEHSEAILSELGYRPEEIEWLRQRGVIRA